MEKYKNKYRIDSARLKNWNYANSAAYFVTICTANREHFFGEIMNGKFQPSEIGLITEIEWIKSVEIRPDMNLSLGEYVVMPNHFHGILFIGDNDYNGVSKNKTMVDDGCGNAMVDRDAIVRDAMHGVSTGNTFGSQSKNLASIIRGFKSAVTTHSRKNNIPFNWQPRFHDHIIRNETEFEWISNYIRNNVTNWTEDKFFKN